MRRHGLRLASVSAISLALTVALLLARAPPALYVQDVYTISTPHTGAGYAFLGGFYEVQEMQTGSAFKNALNRSASGRRDSQATDGTDWTTMANHPSDSDFVDTNTSAVHMDGGHKLLYISPRYSHDGSLNDNNEAWDATMYRCDGCTAATPISAFETFTQMPHNDGYVDQALYHTVTTAGRRTRLHSERAHQCAPTSWAGSSACA